MISFDVSELFFFLC